MVAATRDADGAHTRDVLVAMLTFITGTVDALGFIRLGGVFTSVMTGNMVLLGLSVGLRTGTMALHVGVAFVGYICGSWAGSRVAGPPVTTDKCWPSPVTRALTIELVLFTMVAIAWQFGVPSPHDGEALLMLFANAAALGVQSAAILRFGVSGLSTTYLTGTLTNLVAGLVSARRPPGLSRSALLLAMLIGGAIVGSVTSLYAAPIATVVQPVILVVVVVVPKCPIRTSRAIPDRSDDGDTRTTW